MAPGAKIRSQLTQKRFDDIVALHRQTRRADRHLVIVVVAAEEDQRLPAGVVARCAEGEVVLAALPVADARRWLDGASGLDKWDVADEGAMDVAVLAAGGVSIMRLTAR